MLGKIRTLLRVTAVKLSLLYTIAFAILAIIVVVYMTGGAVNYLRQQLEETVNAEVSSLREIYDQRGLNALIQVMERRASAPGAKLYVVGDAQGRILAGNIRNLEPRILEKEGWTRRPFKYEGFLDVDIGDHQPYAIARVFLLPNGMRILIGQDIGEPERFRSVVARALWFAMGTMLLASFLIWFFVGRSALKRIDMVSKSTERVLSGDRSERLPVIGTNDEFDRLSNRMNQMLDRINLLDDGLKDVSDSIAHDLKTPLTRLRNKVDAALQNKLNLKQSREVLADVIADSDQLIKTFNALLMISRVESGSQVAELVPLNLSEIIRDMHELYEPVAEDAAVNLVSDISDDIYVTGNRELLSQAIANLLDNALKYAAPSNGAKAQIILNLFVKDGQSVAEVRDNGPGIPTGDRDRAKERFSRLDESRSKPGNGLGLSLVEAVAKLHDGKLELDDASPGLIARLILPVGTAPK